MFDLWIKLKVWTEFIIPCVIFGILIFVIFVLFAVGFVQSVSLNRKMNFLQQNGYERFLKGVSSVVGKTFYAWKNAKWDIIDERDLEKISFKQLKAKIK